jgi:hypothetical protein
MISDCSCGSQRSHLNLRRSISSIHQGRNGRETSTRFVSNQNKTSPFIAIHQKSSQLILNYNNGTPSRRKEREKAPLSVETRWHCTYLSSFRRLTIYRHSVQSQLQLDSFLRFLFSLLCGTVLRLIARLELRNGMLYARLSRWKMKLSRKMEIMLLLQLGVRNLGGGM